MSTALYSALILFGIPVSILIVLVIVWRRFGGTRCPVCGSRNIEKTLKQLQLMEGQPVRAPAHGFPYYKYKYKCRKCGNEWEDED